MTPDAQVALIVGIIAGVAALAGALGGTGLGWWLNRSSERRSEKRAAFVELLSAMDNCQQACNLVSIGVTRKSSDAELNPYRTRALEAAHRVETAGNLAILSVGPEHEQTLKNGMLACANEVRNANHGPTRWASWRLG
jgi:hypothetical protein